MGRRTRAAGCGVALAALVAAGPAAAISGTDTIRTYAGNGQATTSGDGGPATAAGIPGPIGITAAPDGSIFIPSPAASLIRLVSASGAISSFAGTGVAGFSGDGGPATAAQLNEAVDAAVDAAGNLYIADRANHRIRRVTPAGVISTIAGNGVNDFGGRRRARDEREPEQPGRRDGRLGGQRVHRRRAQPPRPARRHERRHHDLRRHRRRRIGR